MNKKYTLNEVKSASSVWSYERTSMFITPLVDECLTNNRAIHSAAVKLGKPDGDPMVDFQGLGFVLVQRAYSRTRRSPGYQIFRRDDSIFTIDDDWDANLITSDPAMITWLHDWEKKYARPEKALAKVLISTSNGLAFTMLGFVGVPLEAGNYEDKVVENFRYFQKELVTKRPNGRLTILDGPPGTGKSFLVKAAINDLGDIPLLIIPSHLTAALQGPDLLGALLDEKEEDTPMVILLEDADECLTPRGPDNMSMISTILNFTDGLFGDALDIRIIATTNAEIDKLEPALMRPGRLSRRIRVGELSPAKATEILRRLTGDENAKINKATTLAEVFAKANNLETEIKSEPKLGFR